MQTSRPSIRTERRAWLAPPRAWPIAITGVITVASCSDEPAGTGSGATAAGTGGSGATSSAASNAGPVAVSSSASSSATVGSSSGAGGGDPGWRAAPWWPGPCVVEVADHPAEGFPRIEWTTCPGGRAGCEMLLRNWPSLDPAAIADPVVRTVPGGHELGLFVQYPEFEARVPLVAADGMARAVYRTPPQDPCILTRLAPAAGGHWIGAQSIGNGAVYVFQPDGAPAGEAQVLPFTDITQDQVGSAELFAIELSAAAGVRIFDRATGSAYTAPGAFPSESPQLTSDAAFFLRYEGLNDTVGWSWSRARGADGFERLLDGGSGIVADVRGDGTTLVWIETPPYDGERGVFPPGTLFTSPFTTTSKTVVPSARWALPRTPPQSPAAIGGGYYAVFSEETGAIHLFRLGDARQWTIAVPLDEFRARLEHVTHIDEQYVFFKTDTAVYRQRIDALGDGEAPP